LKKLTDKQKEIIDTSYKSVMNNDATEEQELLWMLANQIHCINTRRSLVNDSEIQEMLNECDCTL
jgi:hypothetical protein